MAITTAQHAKQILQSQSLAIQSAYDKGVHAITSLGNKGRKIVEDHVQSATGKSAEDILGEI